MTLTYETLFFQACGFEKVDRATLPMKVWSDCVRCSKNQACDEVAMIRVLSDVPDAAESQPPEAQVHEVPVTRPAGSSGVARRSKMDEAY
jgi:hypothetical protein